MQQLLTDQLQELCIASEFSNVPMCMWINQDGYMMPVVACHSWIMPKDCFIMLWFWVVCDGRVFNKQWDHQAWSPILCELNPHKQVPTEYESRILEYIHMLLHAHVSTWEPDVKYANFERILDDLAQDACA